jgi:hypothetical protein
MGFGDCNRKEPFQIMPIAKISVPSVGQVNEMPTAELGRSHNVIRAATLTE